MDRKGYVVNFVNTSNENQVFATSQSFEIQDGVVATSMTAATTASSTSASQSVDIPNAYTVLCVLSRTAGLVEHADGGGSRSYPTSTTGTNQTGAASSKFDAVRGDVVLLSLRGALMLLSSLSIGIWV